METTRRGFMARVTATLGAAWAVRYAQADPVPVPVDVPCDVHPSCRVYYPHGTFTDSGAVWAGPVIVSSSFFPGSCP